jgi:pyridinium-3,5-bisthiocarboxylic acid mononucleotide nickel chelatase
MSRIAYFDCYSGASGDMLLAAMLDKAVDFDWFHTELQNIAIPKDSYNIEKTYVNRSFINTCKLNISMTKHEHHHRRYSDIIKIIERSEISEKAKELSKEIFYKLAKAEAVVHNETIEDIHFHEVGSLDSIIDIVGFSICYTSLNVDKCAVSPIPIGSGVVCCEHGSLPVPAPATLEILKGHNISITKNENINEECLTPTATAILCTVASECSGYPDMDNIISIGYGAGEKIFHCNVTSNLRFVLGEINDK